MHPAMRDQTTNPRFAVRMRQRETEVNSEA